MQYLNPCSNYNWWGDIDGMPEAYATAAYHEDADNSSSAYDDMCCAPPQHMMKREHGSLSESFDATISGMSCWPYTPVSTSSIWDQAAHSIATCNANSELLMPPSPACQTATSDEAIWRLTPPILSMPPSRNESATPVSPVVLTPGGKPRTIRNTGIGQFSERSPIDGDGSRDSPNDAANCSDVNDACYAQLLWRCLREAPGHQRSLKDIYAWMQANTNKAGDCGDKGWMNSVRHNLSMNEVSTK